MLRTLFIAGLFMLCRSAQGSNIKFIEIRKSAEKLLISESKKINFEPKSRSWEHTFTPVFPKNWLGKGTSLFILSYSDGLNIEALTGPIRRTGPWGLARIEIKPIKLATEILSLDPKSGNEGHRPLTLEEQKILGNSDLVEELVLIASMKSKLPDAPDQKLIRTFYSTWLDVVAPARVIEFIRSEFPEFFGWLSKK